MKKLSLRVRCKVLFHNTTDSDDEYLFALNLLNCVFYLGQPNKVLSNDISYIHAQEGGDLY
jgi:hypothetical protein